MKNKWLFETIRTIIAIGISLVILSVIIFYISDDPAGSLYLLFFGPMQSIKTMGDVIVLMTPIMFTGVGTCIIFSANSLNLASEGSFFFGGIVTACIAILLNIPAYLLLPVVLLCSIAAGGLVTGIPAYFKMKTNSDELVVSLMLNYIMFFFSMFLLKILIKDHTITGVASWKLPKELLFTPLIERTRIHIGFIVALAVVALCYIAMYKTHWGLKVRLVGSNESFAKAVGINVKRTLFGAQLIGGAIAGLGGCIELLGLYKRFTWIYSTNYGWDGVLLATLARNNPLYIPVAAFFIAYLRIGSDIMSRRSDVPKEVLGIVQGIIIILIIAEKLVSGIEKRALYRDAKKREPEKGAS